MRPAEHASVAETSREVVGAFEKDGSWTTRHAASYFAIFFGVRPNSRVHFCRNMFTFKVTRCGSFSSLVIVCLLLSSCSLFPEHKRELKGEIFIVTNGAQNIKLALVEVRVIPEADMNVFISHKQTAIDKERQDLQAYYENADSEYQKARVAADQANAQHQAALQTEKRASDKSVYQPIDEFLRGIGDANSAFEKYKAAGEETRRRANLSDQLKRTAETRSEDRKKAQEKLDSFPTAEFYFDGLPAGMDKTTTNSNGEFSLTVPSNGKFALAALASRQVVGERERYYWLVWVSLEGRSGIFSRAKQAKTVTLSNNNLMTADSPDVSSGR